MYICRNLLILNITVFKPKINYNVKPSGSKGFKGELTANYIIVPKKQGNLPIALEGFSYFDPEEKKYKQVALSTIPLFVADTRTNGI